MPVAIIATAPYVFVVNPSVPVKDTKGFIELLEHMAKIKLQHVPYKGGGPAVSDRESRHQALIKV